MKSSRRPSSLTRVASLVLSLTLLASLCAPLAPRTAATTIEATMASPRATTATSQAGHQPASRAGELLVRFRAGTTEAEKEAVANSRGGRRGRHLSGNSSIEKIELPDGQTPESVASNLRTQSEVEFVEPNFLIAGEQTAANDPRFSEQWALQSTGQQGGQPGSDINAPAAWTQTTGSTSTVIAVIDSGIDFTHPDLKNNEWANTAERVNGRDDDHNGFVDDLHGWDWVANSNQITDQSGHGTAVAGIIAAEGNNGVGTSGVMWRASLMSLRVLDNTGTGDVASAVEAIDYAVAHGVQIINLSWGTDGESVALKDAIARAGAQGVLVVCSAGNGARNIDGAPYYPASYNLPNMIAVAATNNVDQMTTWSNWGAKGVAVAAPGNNILTTHPGGDYSSVSGTSAAAPVVSGIAGLVKTLRPDLGASAVKSAIIDGARRVAGLNGVVASGGVANAQGALAATSTLPIGSGSGSGNGNGNGNGNSNSGDSRGSGGSNGGGQRLGPPPPPEHGRGGHGPNGSFDVAPSLPTKAAPPGFGNQDEIRRAKPTARTAPTTLIHADTVLPVCDAACGGDVSPSAGGSDPYFATARTKPANRTGVVHPTSVVGAGEDPGSMDINWGIPLVQLAGRAGLDLGVSLYYNSLVWTRQGDGMMFNADHGFPGPGFHLGFPTLQPQYVGGSVSAYLMITPSGGRVELGQVGASTYESVDGSYTQLTENGNGTRTVRATDGTQLLFTYYSAINEYRCTQITDRNGNYITVNYDAIDGDATLGRPTSVVDTLGRTVTFDYGTDGKHYLRAIKQQWQRDTATGLVPETHTWAAFNYDTLTVQTNFPGLSVYGPGSDPIPVLASVVLPDQTAYAFDYSSWGQVYRIRRVAPNGHTLAQTTYDLPVNANTAQSDCPRFSQRRDWAEYWNNDNGNQTVDAGEEAVTDYSVTQNATWTGTGGTQQTGTMTQISSPAYLDKDNVHRRVVMRSYAKADGWDAGLPAREDTVDRNDDSGSETLVRWVTTDWTEDVTSLTNLSIADSGFENPYVGYGAYQNAPSGGAWTFTSASNGAAGISGNASALTTGNPSAPEGGQVAYLYGGNGGSVSQVISGFKEGVPYLLTVNTAQRHTSNTGGDDYDVYLDDRLLATFRPYNDQYGEWSAVFATTGGSHTLKFVGRDSSGTNNHCALIDNVRITASEGNQINPRIAETNIYDNNSNRKRTTFEYTDFNLPATVREYATDGQTVLRRTSTTYRLDTAYLTSRVIGLPSVTQVYDGESTLVSKIEYQYDADANFSTQTPGVRYQSPGYFAGRGDVTGVRRYNVNYPDDTNQAVWVQQSGYDLAGSTVWTQDAAGHRTNVSYADNYSDGANHNNTLAYPTSVTINDPGAIQTTMQYNFDLGAVYRTVDPKGAAAHTFYDDAGRVERTVNEVNNAYVRYAHDMNGGWNNTYSSINTVADDSYTNTFVDGAGRARGVTESDPNSAGGYLVTQVTYDALGRTVARSNPTETNAAGIPYGDDAGGYRWTRQAYDWKGRPTLTTFPAIGQSASNTSEMSYGGCGCAGGEVTTVRDERGRKRVLTADVLGRLHEVDELNWDGTTYAATTYTYNARDQITTINQVGQTRTMDYDGHGRLWHRTTPEQGTTTYAYNADDTTASVTDARGAVQAFVYNNRHLVTNVNFTAGGATTTPNVSMAYDAAGNRTSMTDGLGSVGYTYDTLSELTQETRSFNGVGSFSLSYEYNLAGELKRVTNPWGAQVAYTYDAEGRATDVKGTDTSNAPTYASVATYAQSLRYRAFGGLKSMTYGNSKVLSLAYDERLRLTQWDVSGVLGWNYAYDIFGENSGRVTYAENIDSRTTQTPNGGADATLNRSYDYDQVGRLWVSHMGNEADAHAGVATQWPSNPSGAYSQQYGYDVWGNTTSRLGWGGANASYSASYTNNRRDGLQYDSAGNVTSDGGQAFTYDATGQQASASYSGYTLSQAYDGDRLRVQKTENGATTYYLRSSVLGGQVVAEINSSGGWTRGYVYLGSQLLAVQSNDAVTWMHADPVTKSQRATDIFGSSVSSATVDVDPWGGETSRSSSAFQPHKFTSYERDGNASDEAMMRRYNRWWSRFDQPDPADSSYDLTNPQSLNRYAYTGGDPVNFVDPTGLTSGENPSCIIHGQVGYIGSDGKCHQIVNETVAVTAGDPFWDGFRYGGGALGWTTFIPQNPYNQEPPDTCGMMANTAQVLANTQLQFWGSAENALIAFDMAFSQQYLGNNGIGTTYQSAVAFNDAPYRPRTTALGEEGFRPEFQDHEGDQTHHFAAHLSAGINNQLAAHRAQKVTDTFNEPDRLLSNAAYKIGQDLRNDPNKLKTIGDRIRNDICDKK